MIFTRKESVMGRQSKKFLKEAMSSRVVAGMGIFGDRDGFSWDGMGIPKNPKIKSPGLRSPVSSVQSPWMGIFPDPHPTATPFKPYKLIFSIKRRGDSFLCGINF